MQLSRLLCFCGIALLILSGCGQTVQQTLHIAPHSQALHAGEGKTVVILPFADYSKHTDVHSAHRRYLNLTENLTDRLVTYGFHLPILEDVFSYLADRKIISIKSYAGGSPSLLQEELQGEWSSEMKKEISKYMGMEQAYTNKISSSNTPGTHGLTTRAVTKIGKDFSADYVIRGRIIEYKSGEEHTWAPWKMGVLPFVTETSDQIMFGTARSDKYDNWDNMAVSGTIGGILGHNSAEFPWNSDGGNSVLGVDGGEHANAIFWGAMGATLGQMAKNSGKVPQAVVQLRMWAQDAHSGDVVWTNRIEVRVAPESLFSDQHYNTLFNSATEKAVATLVDEFVSQGL